MMIIKSNYYTSDCLYAFSLRYLVSSLLSGWAILNMSWLNHTQSYNSILPKLKKPNNYQTEKKSSFFAVTAAIQWLYGFLKPRYIITDSSSIGCLLKTSEMADHAKRYLMDIRLEKVSVLLFVTHSMRSLPCFLAHNFSSLSSSSRTLQKKNTLAQFNPCWQNLQSQCVLYKMLPLTFLCIFTRSFTIQRN